MQKFNSIHETALKGIVDVVSTGLKTAQTAATNVTNKIDNVTKTSNTGTDAVAKMRSLNSAAQGLTLTFPCMCSSSLSIESANLITKALERKDVSLLQIVFSAYNLTSATNAADFLKNFHTNLNADKLKLDDVIQILDNISSMSESSIVPRIPESKINMVKEDCRQNINYVFQDDINKTSLNDYTVVNRFGDPTVIKSVKEAVNDGTPMDIWEFVNTIDTAELNKMTPQDVQDAYHDYLYNFYKDDHEKAEEEFKKQQLDMDKQSLDLKHAQLLNTINTNRLIPTDVKKANEAVPTLMVVNFYTNVRDKFQVENQAVIGVKSKLYSINSKDIIDKLVQKNIDSNFLLKLVKVSTREISFVKDFLLAIDNAKIDALAKTKKGSTSKLFKILERRSLKGRVRRLIGGNVNCKPITSLVLSMEEVEYMKKFNNLDLMNPNTTRKIMEQLNLMFMVIVDESNEVAHFLADTGDDLYESISFDHLERESNDAGYKKMINLISRSR